MPVFPYNNKDVKKSIAEIEKAYSKCIVAAMFRIKWKDIFNLKEWYRGLHEWLMEYGWTDMEFGTDHYETLYFESIGLHGDKELWARWRPQKVPVNNHYYKYHMDFDMHYLYLVPTEVMHEGKKYKKNIYKGEVEIKVTSLIEPDFKKVFQTHPVMKYFDSAFLKRIFKKDIFDRHKRELYRETYVLQNFVKHWLKLKRFLPEEEIQQWFPSEAYPTYTKG